MTDQVEATPRRVRRRSGRRGLRDGTVAEGGNVADLNQEVEGRAAPPIAEPLSDTESTVGSRTDAPSDFTPANRMRDVGRKSAQYEREYRLKLLHRMLMRNVPLDQIAKELNVSVLTIHNDRRELFARLREAAQNLDISELIGDTLGFYQEVQGMGLRAASTTKAPLNMRLAAMRTALAAKNDAHRFLDTVGVFEVLKFRLQDQGASSDMERLIATTEAMLDGKEVKDCEDLQSISHLIEQEEMELLK